MQREKNRTSVQTDSTSLKVVTVKTDHVQIEREIEKSIKKVRSLISKLRPVERQRYFNGLLAHILDEPIDFPASKKKTNSKSGQEKDYSNLSFEELQLIEELSVKMEQLYRTMDQDPS
ncbi:MAG: hypothetical protein NT126_06800 [Bacteroidetes bacterium]|nr:hypothetical protein [Bacteroidota bacterium]